MTAKTRRAALFAEMLATQIGGTRQLLQRGLLSLYIRAAFMARAKYPCGV